MNETQEIQRAEDFHEGELVTWHFHDGNHSIPVPGVIVRQDSHDVVIRVRIQGTIKELSVDPEQLAAR